MDLLRNAYSASSDDDDNEPEPKLNITEAIPVNRTQNPLYEPPSPSRKRPKPESFKTLQMEPPIPGRYISKRERALSSKPVSYPKPDPPSASPFTVLGSITESSLPRHTLSSLKQPKGHSRISQIPQRLSVALSSHTKAVNALSWSPNQVHLLASAGMDGAVCIWNAWSNDQKLARLFRFHKAGVKDVKWLKKSPSILSCGYDRSSRLVDVEKGMETQIFKEDQFVHSIKFHPNNFNLFLSGGSNGHIRLWDIRTGEVVNEYVRGLGPILDVEFIANGKQFISSSDVSGSNVSENSIIVWDLSRQVPLSNQIYVEAFTCTSIRSHPSDPLFVAQSNGNYVAIFSSTPPFRLDKYKRYEGHRVFGFPIKCNFSVDGERLVSGSSDGCIYFYSYRSSKVEGKIQAYEQACIDVEFHPTRPDVVASCSWDGDVSVYE